MNIQTKAERPRALLIAIKTPKQTELETAESLAELARLVDTLGFTVMSQHTQRMPSTSGATALGAGKLRELAKLTGGKGIVGGAEEELEEGELLATVEPVSDLATVVVFDCELRPSQLRHLEAAFGVEVLDRTGVIIEIFSRHAKTRTARLQVEIARLNYVAPRIRETGSSSERQAGRGSGESALETERRSIRDQLAQLKRELASLQEGQSKHRSQRSEQACVALVGYTNAGKSSTMRALTGSDVLVQDKLFATLDTTVRAMKPETQPRILISDTVGFIKKLPHDLVASFRSTLDEALNASLLLYIVDASDPTFRNQLEVVDEALREVGVKDTASLLILNKADKVEPTQKKLLQREFPEAILMSAKEINDISILRESILQFFEKDMQEEEFLIPYATEGAIGEIRASMRVTKELFEENGTRLFVRARPELLAAFKRRYSL